MRAGRDSPLSCTRACAEELLESARVPQLERLRRHSGDTERESAYCSNAPQPYSRHACGRPPSTVLNLSAAHLPDIDLLGTWSLGEHGSALMYPFHAANHNQLVELIRLPSCHRRAHSLSRLELPEASR